MHMESVDIGLREAICPVAAAAWLSPDEARPDFNLSGAAERNRTGRDDMTSRPFFLQFGDIGG